MKLTNVKLTVTGNKNQRHSFLLTLLPRLNFSIMIPCKTKAESLAKWGTPDEPINVKFKKTQHSLEFTFQTQNIPFKFFHEIQSYFSELHFTLTTF